MEEYGTQRYKFAPGDEVCICQSGSRAQSGPYLIEKAENGRYTLCNDDGKTIMGSQTYEDKDLKIYNSFE